jgi:hypothetical protein
MGNGLLFFLALGPGLARTGLGYLGYQLPSFTGVKFMKARGISITSTVFCAAALVLAAAPASAQLSPDKNTLSPDYTAKTYSPYAHRAFPENPL